MVKTIPEQAKKGDKMSIEKLEKDYENYILSPSFKEHHVGMFMQHTINVLKDLRKQLAQKQDAIDVKNIKEVRNLNG